MVLAPATVAAIMGEFEILKVSVEYIIRPSFAVKHAYFRITISEHILSAMLTNMCTPQVIVTHCDAKEQPLPPALEDILAKLFG